MNRKSLFMLAVLAVALVVAWYWIGQTQRSPEVAQMPAWLPELQAVQVSAIDVQRAGQPKVRLERREQGWVVPDKADYPADQAAVAALLNALVEARRVEPRTANPELHGRLGLAEQGESEQQAVRLTLEQTEQPPLVLLIGKPGQHDGQLVRQVGDPQSWLISRRIELPATELQWLDRRITAVPFSAVRELDLQHATGERLTLLRDTPQDASLQPSELPRGKRLAFEGAANGMGQFFADLRFADAAPLAQLDFAGKPALRFTLRTFDDKTLKGRIHSKGEQYWLLLDEGSELSASELFGRSDWAYRVEAYQYQSLSRKLTDLLATD